jgi:lactate 2-monooxygenase
MRPNVKGLLIWVAVFNTRSPFARAQSAQELISSVLNPKAADDNYSSYSSEIYYNHTLYNQTPIASTNYDRLEASAKLLLSPAAYDYARGGAGLEKTLAANRDAFDRVGDTPISSTPPRLAC